MRGQGFAPWSASTARRWAGFVAPVMRAFSGIFATHTSGRSSGMRRVLANACTIAWYSLSASTGRFSGAPSLYLPAVVSPAQPVK